MRSRYEFRYISVSVLTRLLSVIMRNRSSGSFSIYWVFFLYTQCATAVRNPLEVLPWPVQEICTSHIPAIRWKISCACVVEPWSLGNTPKAGHNCKSLIVVINFAQKKGDWKIGRTGCPSVILLFDTELFQVSAFKNKKMIIFTG